MPAEVRNDGDREILPESSMFKVAVLGDSQKGLRNLTNLARAVQEEQPVLILHTGDLVSHNDEGHYRLAALALERANLKVPMRVVPGNHDVKGGADLFRKEIGDLEWVIRCGRVVFIAHNNARGTLPDLDRLDGLSARYPDAALVLLMHVPPFDLKRGVRPGYEPFLAWLKKSRVRYLLCGHVHDYVRKKVGNTVVIANGVGGDYDNWQFDQKVYATILDVDGATLSDRTLELLPEHGVKENLEHLAVGHVAGKFRRHPVSCWSGTVVLAGLSVGAGLYLRRKAG